MAKGATYTFTLNTARINQLKANVDKALLKMAIDIETQAKRNAPYDSGNLVNSIRNGVDNDGTHYVMAGGSFNEVSVPYALRREFENNLHPSTKFYMKNAFEAVTANYQKYFMGVTG